MSAPAWDVDHDQVWYSDSNSGFYAVKLTNGITAALRNASPAAAHVPAQAVPPKAPPASAPAGSLPTTGPSREVAGVAMVLLLGGLIWQLLAVLQPNLGLPLLA